MATTPEQENLEKAITDAFSKLDDNYKLLQGVIMTSTTEEVKQDRKDFEDDFITVAIQNVQDSQKELEEALKKFIANDEESKAVKEQYKMVSDILRSQTLDQFSEAPPELDEKMAAAFKALFRNSVKEFLPNDTRTPRAKTIARYQESLAGQKQTALDTIAADFRKRRKAFAGSSPESSPDEIATITTVTTVTPVVKSKVKSTIRARSGRRRRSPVRRRGRMISASQPKLQTARKTKTRTKGKEPSITVATATEADLLESMRYTIPQMFDSPPKE